MGIKYDSEDALQTIDQIMTILEILHINEIQLAKEGQFILIGKVTTRVNL